MPEIAAPSFRTMEHARIWLEHGHQVTVVTCAPNSPGGKVFGGYRNRLYQEETLDGVRVVRVWSYMAPNQGVVKRTLDYISFMVAAVLLCWRFPDFDVILATSPTFFTAVAGYAISGLRRRPWVFEIRDLWPASIRAVGASRSGALDWVEKLELFLYRKAHRIISLTRAFKRDLVSRGIPAEKNDVVMNAVDVSEFDPSRATFDARERLGVPKDAFLAGYIGTTGMAHGLETVLGAAERCRDRKDIWFLILGEGAERANLEAEAKRRGLSRVLFHDFVPRADVVSYLKALDVSIIHLRPDPVFKTVIPSKIFENLAMGNPVLLGVEGEAAEIVEESGGGECIPPGDPVAMADALKRLSGDRAALEAMSRRGRRAAEERYSRRANAIAALASFEAAIATWRRTHP